MSYSAFNYSFFFFLFGEVKFSKTQFVGFPLIMQYPFTGKVAYLTECITLCRNYKVHGENSSINNYNTSHNKYTPPHAFIYKF